MDVNFDDVPLESETKEPAAEINFDDVDFDDVPMESTPAEAIPVTPRERYLTSKPTEPEKSQAFTPTGEPADPFEGESTWSKTKRLGQQTVQGVTEVVAGVPEGMALSGRAEAYEARRKFTRNLESLTKQRDELLKSSDPDKDSRVKDLNMQIGFAEYGLKRINEDLKRPLDESGGFATSEAIRSGVESVVGTPDPRDQSMSGKLAGGFGSLLAFIGTTVVAAKSGGKGVATGVGAVVGSTSTAASFYKEARQLGADEETAVRASQWGALIGSAEIVPIMTGLKYLPPALRVKVTNALLKKAVEIGESGVEEGIQEYLGQVGENLTMIGKNIDPNRPVTQGAAESALLGAILGTGTGAIGAATSGEPKVQTVPEKGPDAAQEEALKTDRETPSAPPPTEAAPTETTATATVTPAEATEPTESDKSGVTVGETAPDVTAAVTAASNPTAPQKPAEGAPLAAKGEYIKQMAAFREMERKQREAEQAQASTATGAPPVPPDTAQAPEGPQVGGIPAAPTTPATPPPSAAAEALQGLDEAGVPVAPPAEAPVSEVPSPAAEAAEALPPVEPPAVVAPEATSEVTPPADEAPAEPPKERKYRVVRQQDVLLDAGIPEEEFEAMPRKRREQLARDIRAKAERMSSEPLNWMEPEDRAAVISKAWTELQRLRAAKPEATARPPKAAAAVATSKAKEAAAGVRRPELTEEEKQQYIAASEGRTKPEASQEVTPKVTEAPKQKTPEELAAEQAAEEAAAREERVQAAMEAQRQRAAEEETAAKAAGKRPVLRATSEEALRKDAEAAVALEDQQIANAAKAKQAAAPKLEPTPVVNTQAAKKLGKTATAQREHNNATASEVAKEFAPSEGERNYDKGREGADARRSIVERARAMLDAANKRMKHPSKGSGLPGSRRLATMESLQPNNDLFIMMEARDLLRVMDNPNAKYEQKQIALGRFMSNEFILRQGMRDEYLKGTRAEGAAAKASKGTKKVAGEEEDSRGDMEVLADADGNEIVEDGENPTEPAQIAKNMEEKLLDRAAAAPAKKQDRDAAVTDEVIPGVDYDVGRSKKPVIAETKKRPKIDKAKIAQNAKTIPKKIAEVEAADPKKSGTPDDPNIVATATPPGWSATGDADATAPKIKTAEEIYFIKNNFLDNTLVASLRRLLKMVLEMDPWVAARATDYDTFSNMLGRLTDEQMAKAMESDRLWDESRGARDPEITKLIIERMNTAIGDVQVYVVSDVSMDGYNPNAGAYYTPQYDHIVIRESAFKDPEKFLHDIIHEGAHAALWAAVRKNPVARRQLAQMAAVYNQTLEKSGSSKPYATTNLDEFMSELVSNPNVKNVLSDIQMADWEFELIGVPAPKGKLATGWAYVKALVAKAFGFGDTPNLFNMSIYNRAMDVIDQLLTEAPVARKEFKNLLGDKARSKWQEKQEAEYAAFRDTLPQEDFDGTAAKRSRYEDLGRNTKNKYPPNLNSERRRQSNWHKMVAGGIDQKTAKEINDWLKSEEGKAVDPATVDLLIQDAIEAFGKKKDTSESNDGGGIIPPYKEPPSPGMGPADPIEPQPEPFRSNDKKWVRNLKSFALKNMTLDFIRQKYKGKLVDEKGDISADLIEGTQKRDNIASEFAKTINDVTAEYTDLMRTNRNEAVELAELAMEATRLDVKLGTGGGAMRSGSKGLQGKKRLAELNERFRNNLSDRGREIYVKLTTAYREAHNTNVESLVYNILSQLDTKLSNSQVMDLMKRATQGKLDANDEVLINDKEIFQSLKNAQELKTIKGDYFPQMRFGDWLVKTRVRLTNPGWTSVPMKVGGKKTVMAPVKTEVDGNAVRIIVDPSIRGAQTAAKRKLIEYAEKHEVTLQGISTLYRDKATGKLVSKGDQLIDREYDTVYQANFQVEGVHFFESEKDAYKFAKTDPDVASDVLTRKKLDESALPTGSTLGVIMKRINNNTKLNDAQRKLFGNIVKNAIIASMDGNSARSRYQARRNVRGASKDLARAAVTYGQAAGNFHATLQTAPQIREAMERLEAFASEASNKPGGGEVSDVAQELRDRMATIEGAGEPYRIMRTLATIAYMDKLGTLSHSIINGLQPAGTSMPVLAGRYGAGKAALVLGRAYAKIGAGGVVGSGLANTGRAIKGSLRTNINTTDVIGSIRENLRKEYGSEYDALIDRMLELGAVAPDAGQEVAGMIEADASGVTSKVIGRMDRTLRQMPNAVEAINRMVTAVATYDLAIKGKSKQDAIQEAIDTIFNTQGDYRKKNAPRWMQHPALSWAMQFQKYTQMMFQLTVDMGGRAINGATPAERWIARKQLTYYYLTQAALAGVWGLPGLQIIKLGALALTALDLEPWDDEEDKLRKMIEENTNPTVGSLINNGVLNTLTGFDFSGRLNQSDAGIGFLPTYISKDELKKYFGGLILGNPGGTALDVVGAAESFANGDIETGLEKTLLLKQFSDIIGAYKGVRDNKMTPYEAAGKVIGFRSQKTADQARQKGVDIRASAERKLDEKELRRRLTQALDRRDRKAEMQAIRDIQAYNRELKKRDPKAKPLNPGSVRRYWIMDQRKLKNGS